MFQLLFLFIILLLPEFVMEALHGGSSRILFILQLFFKIFSRSYDPPSYTLKQTWCSTHVLFWGVQVFFILHFEVQFVLPYHLRWCYVILDNFPSCFVFHKLSRWGILNPPISSLELSWAIFHIKLSFKDCRSYGIYQWSKFFFYPPGEIASRLLVLTNPILFPVSGRLSPHNLRCIP